MTRPLARRLLFAAILPLAAGCLPPPTPSTPPRPAASAPPSPVLTSLAAFATVRLIDPETRRAVLETSGGAVIDMTAAPGARNLGALRQGGRVVVAYDANGAVRITPAARLSRVADTSRILATVREVAVGGGRMVLVDTAGTTQEVTLDSLPMMAFATRLRAGDEVSVALAEGAAAPQ